MSGLWLDGEKWDIGYRNLRDSDAEYCTTIRPLLDESWKKFQPFADKDFVAKFALHPDARFWEMYLTNAMLDGGKNVIPRSKRSQFGPDILIQEGGKNIWIEAVTYSAGEEGHPDRVPPLKFDGQAHQAPNDQIELRISAAFSAKSTVFNSYQKKGVVGIDDIKIIAINAGETAIQCSYEGRGSPLTVLFPLGDQYVDFFRDPDRTESGYHFRELVTKSSGAQVEIGMFADSNYSDISACIYSCTSLGNVGYGGNGIALYHNCLSRIPFPSNWHHWEFEWGCRRSDADFELFRIQ